MLEIETKDYWQNTNHRESQFKLFLLNVNNKISFDIRYKGVMIIFFHFQLNLKKK